VNYNFNTQPYTGNIETYLADDGEVYHTMLVDGSYYQTDGTLVTTHPLDDEWTLVLSGLKAGIQGNFSF